VIRSQGKYGNQSGCCSIKVFAKDMEVGVMKNVRGREDARVKPEK